MARSTTTLLLCALVSTAATAEVLDIDEQHSLLAVVTHKDGVAARLAHDHLVVADATRIRCQVAAAELLSSTCQAELEVGELRIDDPELQRRWQDRLRDLEILDQPFSELSPKNRNKVRSAMLGSDQLDAHQYPLMTASLLSLEQQLDDPLSSYVAELELTIREKSVRRRFPTQIELTGSELSIEAVASFEFSEFDIEPYSAMFGAVRNQDRFHLVIILTGEVASLPLDHSSE